MSVANGDSLCVFSSSEDKCYLVTLYEAQPLRKQRFARFSGRASNANVAVRLQKENAGQKLY